MSTTTKAFRGITYEVTLDATVSSMSIRVAELLTGELWIGEFGSQYIAELTQKSGNYKPLDLFARMLEVAVNGASDSVTVDLLTYEDLELLRAQKHGMQAPSAGQHHNIPDK
eukprot:gene29204-8152_t